MHDGGGRLFLGRVTRRFSYVMPTEKAGPKDKRTDMLKLLLHTFSMAFPIVVVVLGIMVLLGKAVFLPWFIGTLIIMIALLVLLFIDKKKDSRQETAAK